MLSTTVNRIAMFKSWVHDTWDGYEYHYSPDRTESIKLEPTGCWTWYSHGKSSTELTKVDAFSKILEQRRLRNEKLVIKMPVFIQTEFQNSRNFPPNVKSAFANQFVRLVCSKFSLTEFPKWFYMKLSCTFGLSGLWDRENFYSSHFIGTVKQHDFIKRCVEYKVVGLANWTMGDAETAIQQWLKDNFILQALAIKIQEEKDEQEKFKVGKVYVIHPVQEQRTIPSIVAIEQQMMGGS